MELTSPSGPPPASHIYRYSSPSERERRLTALRDVMQREDLGAIVVAGRDDIRYRGRTFYVSDVWQLVADSHVIILPEGAPVFVGGQVFGLEQAEQSDWVEVLRVSGTPGVEIAGVLNDNGLGNRKIGVVGLSDAAFAAKHLHEMQEGAPEATFVDVTDAFEAIRQVNSEEELGNLRATSELMRQIYAALEPSIVPRMREIDLAAAAHRVSREHGLRDPMVLLQTTPYGAIAFGTTRQIRRDDLVTVWIESAGPSGYWLEYRRCYSFGPPSQEHQRFWQIQVEGVSAGLEVLKPGEPAHGFALAVQGSLESKGYSLGFADPGNPHSMFSLHGIGTDAIQGVWVPGKDRVLAENEVVNIHPVVDFKSEEDLHKFGWLGISDNALITSDGGVMMTNEPGAPEGFIEL